MTLTRRQAVALLLGLPFASAGCARRGRRPIPAQLLGGSMALGHRLKQPLPDLRELAVRSTEVAIVGGGMAGLSAAWWLRRQGVGELQVFELEGQLGGTSSYGLTGVVPHPWGAHYLPMPRAEHESLCALLAEMGTLSRAPDGSWQARENELVREPEERLCVCGEFVEGLIPGALLTTDDRVQWSRFDAELARWVRFRDAAGRRAFTLPLDQGSDAPELQELDRITAREWLTRHRLTSPRLLWWLEYGCRDDYGCTLDTTSAWALLFYHAARVTQPGEESAPFLTWPEGNGRIVRHLESQLTGALTAGALVLSVTPSEQYVELLVYHPRTDRYERWRAAHAILAVPQFIVARLLPGERARASAFSYSPWLVANLHLHRRPASRGYPMAWDNVIYGGSSLGYVVATHQTLRDDGPTIWTYYQPLTDAEPRAARARLAVAEPKTTVAALLHEFREAHPDLESCLERVELWHWGHAMIRPVPGMIFGPERRAAAKPVGRVHFAHTDLSGVALLDEAHAHGVRAASEILALRRGSPEGPRAGQLTNRDSAERMRP